jgi:hypothetical protein
MHLPMGRLGEEPANIDLLRVKRKDAGFDVIEPDDSVIVGHGWPPIAELLLNFVKARLDCFDLNQVCGGHV